MSEIIGRQIEVGFGLEAVRGVLGASVQKWTKYLTTSIQEKIEKVEDASQHNSFADADGHRIVQSWVEGELTGNVHIDDLGYLLTSLMGSPTTTLVEGSVNDHLFKLINEATHPSLSLFVKDGSVREKGLNGCLINTLSLEASVKEYLKFTANMLGRNMVDSSVVPVYDTVDYDFIGKEISIKIADNLSGLSSATPVLCKDMKLNFENGAELDYVLSSLNPNDGYATKFSIDGSLTKNFIDTNFSELFKNGNAKYMEIDIVGDALLDATNHPTITLILNKVLITDWSKKGDADKLVEEDISFKAYFNSADAEMYQLTLRNLTAGYSTGV